MEELVKSGRGAGVTGEARRYVIKKSKPWSPLQGCAQKLRTYHAQDVLVRVLGQLQYHLDKHFGLVVGPSTSCIRVYIHEQVSIGQYTNDGTVRGVYAKRRLM